MAEIELRSRLWPSRHGPISQITDLDTDIEIASICHGSPGVVKRIMRRNGVWHGIASDHVLRGKGVRQGGIRRVLNAACIAILEGGNAIHHPINMG